MDYKATVERAINTAHQGRVIAHELESASRRLRGTERDMVAAYALRLKTCNDYSNTWIDEASTRRDEKDLYHQTGRYWRCSSKLCPSCLRLQVRRTRLRAMDALKRQTVRSGEHYHFITMTIPNTGQSLSVSRSIVNRAWTLFRKRDFCVASLKGGVKAEEFTLTTKGIHYHLHLITLGKSLYYNRVRDIWTNCVAIAFREHGLDFVCNNRDGFLSVKIKRVTPNYKMVSEVCKYVTKSSTWRALPDATLVEIATKLRWSRMFELFGTFAERSTEGIATKAKPESKTILDTRSISDGDSYPTRLTWRNIVEKEGVEAYQRHLLEHVADLIYYEQRRFDADETTKYRKPLPQLAAAQLQCA